MRYNSLVERCKANRYSSRTYKDVENKFASCEQFVNYVWDNFPMDDYRGWEIDRVNTNGHYEPNNIRLATREQNAQTRRANIMVEYMGERMSVSKFTRDHVSNYCRDWVTDQVHLGLTAEQIVQKSRKRNGQIVSYQDVMYTKTDFFRKFSNGRAKINHLYRVLNNALQDEATLSQVLYPYMTLSMQELETVSVITE